MTRVVKIHARISEVTSAKFILARRAHQVQRGEVLRGNPDSPVLSLVSTSSSSANISLEPRRSVGGTENNVRSPASKWLTCVSLGCPAAPPSCKARLKTQNVAQNSMDPIQSSDVSIQHEAWVIIISHITLQVLCSDLFIRTEVQLFFQLSFRRYTLLYYVSVTLMQPIKQTMKLNKDINSWNGFDSPGFLRIRQAIWRLKQKKEKKRKKKINHQKHLKILCVTLFFIKKTHCKLESSEGFVAKENEL